MNGVTQTVVIAVVTSLLMVGGAVSTASAAPPVKCGTVIKTNTTLQDDVGPCSGDGLIVGADDVTLDLGGHRIYGKKGAAEPAGVLFDQVTGSTVRNGTVTGFDAGVAVEGGSGNTVTGLALRDNINDNTGSSNDKHACTFGDGIIVESSDGNTVSSNTVIHNGPFSGVSLVEDSDGNTVRSNTVADDNVPNASSSGRTGNCGAPFSRPIQDIGIRVEGPGADDNVVRSNQVTNSAIGGITIHGYVYCPPLPGEDAARPTIPTRAT